MTRDELLLQHLYEFEGKPFKSLNKGTVNLGTEEEEKQRAEQLKQKEADYAAFMAAWQKKLDEYVKQMRLSTRLVGSPVCLVTEEHEFKSRTWSACCKKEKEAGRAETHYGTQSRSSSGYAAL